jgi:vancomycin resistance protein YoaR
VSSSFYGRLSALLFLAFALAGCGLFGDDDEAASPDGSTEVVVTSVRVEAGGRWFDINPALVEVNDAGLASAATIDLLRSRVTNLSLPPINAVHAGIAHDGSVFAVVPSSPGQVPDIEALARIIAASAEGGVDTVEVPFTPSPAALTNEEAQVYADELNDRIAGGITVSIGGEKSNLPESVLGPATTVSYRNGDWDVSVNYDRIDAELARMFPGVGQEGGEASFTVQVGETSEDPSTVVIVPGAPRTICCSAASVRRIEQALTTDLEVATLLFKNVDSERGTEWAKSLGIDELVGSFTTSYTAGQNRVINIRRIAELTQGFILDPGGTFSLNEYVGRRTTENGFVPAGTIVNGHLVDSVGGGISQFATTIFNASFFAGLEFEKYQSHSIYFSRYPYGREATISWPAPELEITNPSPYAVLIWPTSTETSVTVDLYSTKWVDVEQTGQSQGAIGAACTRVTTQRTRTFVDDETEEIDTVFATYRPEGIACDGSKTQNPNEEQVDKLEDGEDPEFEDGGTTTTTTTVPPTDTTTTTTTVAPTTTTTAPTTTTTTAAATTTTTSATTTTTTTG